MLKRLDKLIISAFVGPLVITTAVLVFIFLVQFLIMEFDKLIGKNLPITVFLELIGYLSLHMVPNALPLSFLLASLITFGTLGEFSELTAIKASGISLLRIIQPVFLLVVGLSLGSILFTNYVLPHTNLKAFSLLYDIKTKKVGFSLKPGSFYTGLPGYSIKANYIGQDGKSLRDVIIYDHSDGGANNKVTMADSGYMYTILADKYLVLELYSGKNFTEMKEGNQRGLEFVRNEFDKSKVVFSLSSFDLTRTRQELFSGHKFMRNIGQLSHDIDSLEKGQEQSLNNFSLNMAAYYNYTGKPISAEVATKPLSSQMQKIRQQQLAMGGDEAKNMIYLATNHARNIKSFIEGYALSQKEQMRSTNDYRIELQKKFTVSVACLVLFLIGAPVGSIIRKGGLGVPILVSIIFFIFYYIFTIVGEKWAKDEVVALPVGIWAANVILLGASLFFIQQARRDASLFELDFYRSWFQRLKGKKLASGVVKAPGDMEADSEEIENTPTTINHQ